MEKSQFSLANISGYKRSSEFYHGRGMLQNLSRSDFDLTFVSFGSVKFIVAHIVGILINDFGRGWRGFLLNDIDKKNMFKSQ